MLNDFFILQELNESYEWESDLVQSVYLSNIIDLEKPIDTEKLLRQYYTAPVNYYFNITIKNLAASNIEEINKVFLLFPHPRYLRTEKGYSLFLMDIQQADLASLTLLLRTYFQKQGMPEMDLLPFHTETGSAPFFIHLNARQQTALNSEQEFSTWYNNYLCGSYNFYDSFIIKKAPSQINKQVLQYLNVLNSNAQTANPYLLNHLRELKQIKSDNIKLNQVNEQQKKELEILKELFNINAAHNEMEYVLQFYHKEYEVLPLWYKRFGHIIKFLMGKRSFKSLFSDKHKK
ncbi:MAG: hypothetical protein ACJ751_11735 [Niastella sp.]|uniref:hypothetical protein n=1 Tax=Niastella sp. TaxID=1869183 RepID=UPI003899C491